MQWLISMVDKLGPFLKNGKAQDDLRLAIDNLEAAGPIVAELDHPSAGSGLVRLSVATERLKKRNPKLSTTVARTSIQLAYMQYRAQKG